MTSMALANAIISILVLGAFLVIFYGPWQAACADFARQLIFARRDRLFDLAVDGKISFDSLEYRQLRDELNARIRFAHEATWCSYLWLGLGCGMLRSDFGKTHPRPSLNMMQAVEDNEARAEIEAIMMQSVTIILATMFMRSLVLAPVVAILLLVERGIAGVDRLFRRRLPGAAFVYRTVEAQSRHG